ncbi:MAG: Flp family type IVb pilin [Gammaproteobacteria bacterium]|uniref:Flp family type IVb pilin n=1 Tax=Thiohalobacter sp. COW1 TaxID=2795687 RepID=UPI000C096310|nr:Flp family type IVb pilin [Thiohalobacter sp. COW1]MAT64077.1 Flp family type IVb pilin [Gammaproteobacteria bacterium]BCO31785.1 hypothetical protein TspCOW1_18880 [Thiohalobacter sp. COW1]
MDMQGVKRAVVNFIRDEEGASAIEYVLIAAMVAVALVTFVTPIRTAVTNIFTDIKNALEGATSSGTS